MDPVANPNMDSNKDPDDKTIVQAIIKVSASGYVPDHVTVRARIDSTMFTASLKRCDLVSIKSDPGVTHVELGKKFRNIE